MRLKGRRKNGKMQLKWSMTGTLVVGWLMPLCILTLLLLYFVSIKLSSQIEKTVTVSSDKAIELCEVQLQEAISSSRNASYMNNIRECYYAYQRSGDATVLSGVTGFLNQQYKYDKLSVCTIVFFLKNPESVFYTGNYSNGKEYVVNRVNIFKENVMEQVLTLSEDEDMDITLLSVDGYLYLYRNLMQTAYIPYGVIVMELNSSALFDNLNSVWGAVNYAVYMDGQVIADTGVSISPNKVKFGLQPSDSHYVHNKNGAYVYKTVQMGDNTLNFLIELDSKTLIDDLYGVRYVFFLVIVFMVPLVVMIFIFFHRKVTKPVTGLVKAAKEIREGNYGIQIEQISNSAEFAYLEEAFNAMSKELERQFEKIFLEELALKDANIMALQSQINPHFLNNTLEIINWEARLQGNQKVSGMIEALSTMMNATMNRENKRLITLKEELEYVEAYFYIISQRLGNRFQYEVNVEQDLLRIHVPRLIIQPIVENAVEHGMYPAKQGKITLHIWRKEDMLYIEVKNDNPLSKEDEEKIAKYLYEDDRKEVNWSGSLGIRNVNRRLKIIYGDVCGLQVQRGSENDTVSLITVKIENENIL